MRNLLRGTVLLLALVAAASAQYRRGYENSPAGRVLADLDHARSAAMAEHGHFEHARKDLVRYQEDWSRGRFDRGRLDSALGHPDYLARSHLVSPRDRDILGRDVYDLREFRRRGDR